MGSVVGGFVTDFAVGRDFLQVEDAVVPLLAAAIRPHHPQVADPLPVVADPQALQVLDVVGVPLACVLGGACDVRLHPHAVEAAGVHGLLPGSCSAEHHLDGWGAAPRLGVAEAPAGLDIGHVDAWHELEGLGYRVACLAVRVAAAALLKRHVAEDDGVGVPPGLLHMLQSVGDGHAMLVLVRLENGVEPLQFLHHLHQLLVLQCNGHVCRLALFKRSELAAQLHDLCRVVGRLGGAARCSWWGGGGRWGGHGAEGYCRRGVVCGG